MKFGSVIPQVNTHRLIGLPISRHILTVENVQISSALTIFLQFYIYIRPATVWTGL